jgi:anti-sigma B factor antagonist
MPADFSGHAELIELTTAPEGDVVVVSVAGELDLTTATAADTELAKAVGSGADSVVVDLSRVHFLGSSGLRVLLNVRDQARQDGVDLRLVCEQRAVLHPLEVTGLAPDFQIHESVPAAIAAGSDHRPA